MAFGPYTVFADSIASGASTSDGVDLKKSWNKLGLQVGTMSTSASFSLQNSVDNGSTFYNVYTPMFNTATSGVLPLSVGSGVGANGGFVVINAPLSYPRIVCTGVVDGGARFKFLGVD